MSVAVWDYLHALTYCSHCKFILCKECQQPVGTPADLEILVYHNGDFENETLNRLLLVQYQHFPCWGFGKADGGEGHKKEVFWPIFRCKRCCRKHDSVGR